MSTPDDETIARPTAHHPPADLTPSEFEAFVAEVLGAASPVVSRLRVELHETIIGQDGAYDFDCTVRYELAGMEFLVLVEAKRHVNPIKRELVQILYQKVQSVGAHKGVMISTAPYQRGAFTFARVHGIALVTVTEGRFTFETRGHDQPPPLSRQDAFDLYGIPTFVGYAYGPGEAPGSTSVCLISTEYPEYVAEQLLGVVHTGADDSHVS